MKILSTEQRDMNRILEKIKKNPMLLLNLELFNEFMDLQAELFVIAEKVRKFQFPKSLFDKEYQAFLKDPFKTFRLKIKAFEEKYL